VLQALFKTPDDRTTKEETALENYGIDARTTLGSGEGKSGTSSEIVKLHEAVESEFDSDAVDPTEAVLETVGSLTYDEMSEQELRRTLREFRREAVAEVDDSASIDEQRESFRQTLDACAEQIREQYEEVEPNRPFKKVDILGPEKERYCRWHVRAMQSRGVENHSELVEELYQERLEQLAENEGWS
jgi:hypothetical protein